MEKKELKFQNILFIILHLSSSLTLKSSTAYTPPDKYFINCGSNSNVTLPSRVFVGDDGSGTGKTFSPGGGTILKGSTSSNATATTLYETARIYEQSSSSYELDVVQNGTYFLRLHFSFIASPTRNLSNAVFDVSALGLSLLSNFSLANDGGSAGNLPIVKEFLLFIGVGRFKITFTPFENGFAFVNAIELFIAPDIFLPDSSTPTNLVSADGLQSSDYGIVSSALHTVYRINVGGSELNDSLWRNWIPDDVFLFQKNAAKNSYEYGSRPSYIRGRASEFSAPDGVYQTAKELNIDSTRQSNFFNITWQFSVRKNAKHFVRAHFCDIIGKSVSNIKFHFYIYRNFDQLIDLYTLTDGRLAAPFYVDSVVDSDDSGLMSISVGPQRGSVPETAFLNGLEIMQLIQDQGSVSEDAAANKSTVIIIIICSAVGGIILICGLIAMVLMWLKCRKAKPVENSDWRYHTPSSYSRATEGTVNASPVPNLNLGLKIPFAEIIYATKSFDPKLVIGEGGFGKVYKGIRWNGEKVAVKRSQLGHGQGIPEFQTEIMVLSRIRHHHLVSLVGYCDERSEMILVYEFMEKGTLRDHLYRDSGKPNSELSWKQRLEICIGSARGLHYLHTALAGGIIHRDVKSTNILLDQNYVAKVADFGLSRSGPLDEGQTHVSTAVKGSFGYFDPEYFKCMQLTDKSDVYSFGVVLLEVICARPAINGTLPREQVNLAEWGMFWQAKGELERIIDPFLVGEIKPNSLRKFGETAEKCLKECGADRPCMGDVLWDLEYALQLQKAAVVREPHEDSITDASVDLPLPGVQRLPSYSIEIEEDEDEDDDEDDQIMARDDASETMASDVFSQLKIDNAR